MLAGLLWGTGGLAGALLQSRTGLHPVAVAAYRLLIGGGLATLALAAAVRGVPRTAAVGRRLLAVGGLVAFFQAGYFGAVELISVSTATLLTIGSVPVFVAVACRDRRGRTLVAVGLAVVGLALLAGGPITGDLRRTAVGVALSLAAGAGFAAVTVVTRRPIPGLGGGVTTALGLLLGGLLLLPLALPLGMAVPLRADVLVTAAFLGVVPTAVAYGAYFAGLRGAPAVTAAVASMLEPLTATVLAVILLDDRLTAAGVVGACLLAVALVLTAVPARYRPTGRPGVPGPARSGPSRR
ncbi:membrane protein [Actinokineospora fastidiosa]|uniref:Membrane protein n=1 Tax=Actinokineospora fastidiosa TaxID=1816 RepID=A0A918GNG2_9PSEU|nr:carboxylate/amino acid/amine transporter [Actinokineospora sp. UTMC 2448]GGS49252.1 membrane protein [Actinokineospora fastidiosa]